ncbi:hypothetical protein MKZ38_008138 [Zalerion maritima]|uniref:Uncharacterized protein n=1 Tax=Zalerion maritima TaxID=339359 RepID=A0AAD5WMX1_9PEZI|nr:hypothetical protein MKZ38_008138 [Zalerion maritima]
MAQPKVILYLGAPQNDMAGWDAVHLVSDFDPDLLCLFDPNTHRHCRRHQQQGGLLSAGTSSWRCITYKQTHLSIGISHPVNFDFALGDAVFLFPSAPRPDLNRDGHGDGQGNMDEDEEQSQFYLHSFAVHESQLGADEGSFETSFLPDGDGLSQPNTVEPIDQGRHYLVTALKDIPPHHVLAGFHPAPCLVNLMVGIISITPPFPVSTKWGTREIVNLVVGDETKSGFNITFWMSSAYGSLLASLRRQDVVLLRNIALGSFKNTVHGNSLRNDRTKAHLLCRTKLHPSDPPGFYYRQCHVGPSEPGHPQIDKARRVRDWVLRFVGPGFEAVSEEEPPNAWDQPPDDSL